MNSDVLTAHSLVDGGLLVVEGLGVDLDLVEGEEHGEDGHEDVLPRQRGVEQGHLGGLENLHGLTSNRGFVFFGLSFDLIEVACAFLSPVVETF